MGKHKKQIEEEAWIGSFLQEHIPEEAISKPVCLSILCFMPIPKSTSKKKVYLMHSDIIKHIKKPDVDNLAKNLLDCMTKTRFWTDDNLVYSLDIRKRYDDGKGPRWIVSLDY